MMNTSFQTNLITSNTALNENKPVKHEEKWQKKSPSTPFTGNYTQEQLNEALKAYHLLSFTGPRTTGKESGANIAAIAKKYKLNAEQTQALKEEVQEAKMGKAHHLTRQEVEKIARSLAS